MLAIFLIVIGCLNSPIRAKGLGEGISTFNLAILKDLHKNIPQSATSNLIFSGYSLSQVLAMLSLGSGGDSLDQIFTALQLTSLAGISVSIDSQDEIHTLFSLVRNNLISTANVTIDIANGGYPSIQFALNPDFVNKTETFYNTTWKSLDFAQNPSKSAEIINGDIERATRGNIRDILKANDIGPQTELVLTNAIYFEGNWRYSFDPRLTSLLPFYRDDGTIQQTLMMKLTSRVLYGSTKIAGLKVEAVELKYASDNIIMFCILPPAKSLQKLISVITIEDVGKLKESLKEELTVVLLPAFNATTTLDLKGTLSRLGMPDLFGSKANLSAIAQPGSSGAVLSVSDVVHKAYISVTEKGTVAAAATGAIVLKSALFDKKIFRADRPFLYFILDSSSEIILFMGSYVTGA